MYLSRSVYASETPVRSASLFSSQAYLMYDIYQSPELVSKAFAGLYGGSSCDCDTATARLGCGPLQSPASVEPHVRGVLFTAVHAGVLALLFTSVFCDLAILANKLIDQMFQKIDEYELHLWHSSACTYLLFY